MPNLLGEDWSRNRNLDNGVKESAIRPYSITDYNIPYTITSGDNKGEVIDSLPTTKLQYKASFYLADESTWGDILNWLTPDVKYYYIYIKLHTYIGSNYNTSTKKWNTLYEHHVWDFKILTAVLFLSGIPFVSLMGLSGEPTCKVYKTYTNTPTDVYTEPYKSHYLSTLVNVGGSFEVGTASVYVDVGDSTSAYSDWFFIEGNFPIDTGMYTNLIINNADDYTQPSNQFATLLELDTPKIFAFYDKITGCSHLLYKNSTVYRYDELRLPIYNTVTKLADETYDDIVNTVTEFDSKNKFMSLIVTDKLEKYILFQDTSFNIKIKNYNSNIQYEEQIVVEESSNPVGYYNNSSQTAYVFYCKDSMISVVSTTNFINWSEPTVFIDDSAGKIGKQSVGVVEASDGSIYVLYYDTAKKPQSKLFSIAEIQATNGVNPTLQQIYDETQASVAKINELRAEFEASKGK